MSDKSLQHIKGLFHRKNKNKKRQISTLVLDKKVHTCNSSPVSHKKERSAINHFPSMCVTLGSNLNTAGKRCVLFLFNQKIKTEMEFFHKIIIICIHIPPEM